MWLWKARSQVYEPIRSGNGNRDLSHNIKQEQHTSQVKRLLLILAITCTQILALSIFSAVAYNLGRSIQASTAGSTRPKTNAIDGSSFRRQTMAFVYNRTFSEPPSPETDAAWESIFPPHGGFFNDSVIAPTGGSLAVYHQLHCLDGIRHAYYTLFDAVIAGINVTFSELEDYSTDWHTRHCLDFLRQMLMCNADLTVETVDPALGGIRGFGKGREHECIAWEDVRGWSIAQQQKVK